MSEPVDAIAGAVRGVRPPMTYAQMRRALKCRVTAFDCFAMQETARHPRGAIGDRCCLCEQPRVARQARVTWRAQFNTSADLIHTAVEAVAHVPLREHADRWRRFETFHPICPRCLRRWRMRRVALDALILLGLLCFLGGGIATIGGFGLAYARGTDEFRRPLMIVIGICGAILLVGGAFAFNGGKALRVPSPLWDIGTMPIEVESAAFDAATEQSSVPSERGLG